MGFGGGVPRRGQVHGVCPLHRRLCLATFVEGLTHHGKVLSDQGFTGR